MLPPGVSRMFGRMGRDDAEWISGGLSAREQGPHSWTATILRVGGSLPKFGIRATNIL